MDNIGPAWNDNDVAKNKIHKKKKLIVKRSIFSGENRGQISKLKDRSYEEIHGEEKGKLLKLDRSLKGKGRANKNKGKTYEEIYGDRAEEEKSKRLKNLKHGKSFKHTVCSICGMSFGARGIGLHAKNCDGLHYCLYCGCIVNKWRKFCSISHSTLFACTKETHMSNMSDAKKNSLMENPESHPSRILAGTGRSKEVISGPQRKLYNIVKSLYNKDNVIFNYPVRTKSTVRYIDVALVDRMIGFEFDGVYWHQLREEKDKIRNQELKECGWTIYHFNEQDDMKAKAKLCSEEVIVLGTVGRKK